MGLEREREIEGAWWNRCFFFLYINRLGEEWRMDITQRQKRKFASSGEKRVSVISRAPVWGVLYQGWQKSTLLSSLAGDTIWFQEMCVGVELTGSALWWLCNVFAWICIFRKSILPTVQSLSNSLHHFCHIRALFILVSFLFTVLNLNIYFGLILSIMSLVG